MFQWEYVRIMNRNYLQTLKAQDLSDAFQYKMLLSEQIKGLLPCKEREVNGVTYQLFDISSMQSFASIFAEKKMQFSDFYMLIHAIKSTALNMRTYLLGVENLILYPEFIFRELDTGEISFVCCPCNDSDAIESVKQLYQFLLSCIDYDDSELTDIIYESCEEIEDTVSITWINKIYERLSKLQDERLQEKKSVSDEPEDLFVRQPEEVYCEEPSIQIPDTKLADLKNILIVGGVYILLVGVFVYYLYSNYILSTGENIVTIGVIVIVTALLAFWMFLWLKKKEINGVSDNDYKGDYSKIPFETDGGLYEETEYGKTVFFERHQLENILYGIGDNNRIKIEINKFPFVIGKKADVVDETIDDLSISRMHARFEKQDDKIFISDLNSTNGTYKNGIMLAPHQKIEVFSEDEILLGRLKFIYR